ncbi:hypothetical protein EC844_12555 [Acinetobacter calcoaceticus]|uniref:Uncharacterized protein n=1 Tax=Acinetobacter calcoaceticus TaxID=471 RepID=A0A4R1XEM9_ACICA|nr:hypothetical protein EC844_12555 [Acinetobacter calcoaceticus]
MKNFDKWYEENCANLNVSRIESEYIFQARQAEIDGKDARIKELEDQAANISKLVKSLRSEFDLWSECSQVERQIELLEQALGGTQTPQNNAESVVVEGSEDGTQTQTTGNEVLDNMFRRSIAKHVKESLARLATMEVKWGAND